MVYQMEVHTSTSVEFVAEMMHVVIQSKKKSKRILVSEYILFFLLTVLCYPSQNRASNIDP